MAKIAIPQLKNGSKASPAFSRESEENQISALAYQFFAERGYEHGHDAEDWQRAEAVIKNKKK